MPTPTATPAGASYGEQMVLPDVDADAGAALFTAADDALRAYHRALDARDAWVRTQHANGARDRAIADAVNNRAPGLHTPVSVSNVRAIRTRNPELLREPR